MSIYSTAERRYHEDAAYAALVNALLSHIEEMLLTPTEVREAAMHACFLHEMRHPRPVIIDGVEYAYKGPERR